MNWAWKGDDGGSETFYTNIAYLMQQTDRILEF